MTNRHESAGISAQVSDSTSQTGLASLPMRTGGIFISELIRLYMAHYTGRDPTRVQRLGWWNTQVGTVTLQDLSDDHAHAAIEKLAGQSSRYYAGDDADGRPIYRAKKKPLAPATLNRYTASLAAVITWAIKKRIAPRGYVHPLRTIERRPENNEKLRFLSDTESEALLQACKAAAWPKLHVLVLMALTTGARKGELLGLKWSDLDLSERVAYVGRTKNGQPRVLPLLPAVAEELEGFKAGATSLVFPSRRNPKTAFAFEPMFHAALKTAHIKAVTFHTLRHSCASRLAKSNATLLEIADVLGHRQLAMTKRYAHLTTGHKAKLIDRVFGGATAAPSDATAEGNRP